jgi:hypothetical protein
MKNKYTKSRLLLIYCLLFIKLGALSFNTYSQTITSGSYTYSRSGFAPDLSGTTTKIINSGVDNGASSVTDIGFTFWFDGTPYTQFSVSENGLLTLGSTQISGTDVDNLMSSGTTLPKISPYWGDFSTGTNGYVAYKVTGTAPNRTLVVTWLVTIPKNINGTANSTFQVQLSEASGVVSFTYGTPAVPAGQYSIGIGVSSSDFASITPTSATAANVVYGIANRSNNISPGQYTRYSFTPDAAVPTITYTALTNTLSADNRTLTATIGDARTGIPTSGSFTPKLYYKKNFSGVYISTQGILISGTGTSGSWSFAIDHSAVGGVVPRDTIFYFVIAQDQAGWKSSANIASSPAGVSAADVNTITTPPSAPSIYKILGAPLSGVKTVGSTGADYTSLTKPGGLFEDINDGKLTGDLVVKIITDLSGEPGTKSLNAWTNDAGGPYTVTINPEGNINISGTSTLIKLNGTNRLTIDGINDGVNSLTISSSNGSAVQFSSGASNNIITRTSLVGSGSGVIYFYDVSGNIPTCSNNNINNCVISGAVSRPTTGIYFGSWTTGPQGTYNTINKNIIKDFNQYGIHLDRGYLNFTISNNEIYQTTAGNYSTGIYIYNPVGTTNIFNNKIHDLKSGTALGVLTAGIYYRFGGATDVLNIYNNVISLDAASTNTAAYLLNGLDLEGTGTSNVYYNSIYIGGTGVTSGNSAGLYRTAGTVNFINNAVFNSRSCTTAGQYTKNYGIRTTNFTNFISDNNLIYANGTSGVFGFIGPVNGMNGTDYNTLTEWSSATGQDVSSFSGDPGFTSPTNLAPDINNPNSFALNGNGKPLPSLSADINGNPRNTAINQGPTDIGAYEFEPDAALSPNTTIQVGNIAAGDSTLYYMSGKLVAKINWISGSKLPASVTLKYLPGKVPPGISGTNNAYGYWTINSDGNDFLYDLTLFYSPTSLYTISNESKIAATMLNGNVWSPKLSSTVNTAKKTITLKGLNSFTSFALTDRSSIEYAVANLKVLLQGAYQGSGTMNTALNSSHFIPLNSESAYPSAIYGYTARSVNSIPDTNIVDWILVELRTGTTADTKILTKAGFLKRDGSIVDLDGISLLSFQEVTAGNYYIVVRHRNHFPVMSASQVGLNSGSTLYNFTTAPTQAFGTDPMAMLPGGVYGMIAGDGNSDGNIDYASDLLIQWLPNFGFNGYYPADYNLDGVVEYNDIMMIWLMNFGLSYQLY